MERMMSACETAHPTILKGKRERVRALFKSWQSKGLPSAMSRSMTRLPASVCCGAAKDAIEAPWFSIGKAWGTNRWLLSPNDTDAMY
jgi:hypothetical protein